DRRGVHRRLVFGVEGGQLPAVGGGVGRKVLRVGGVHPAHRIRDGIGEQLRVAQREPDVLVVFGFGVGVAVVVLMGGLHALGQLFQSGGAAQHVQQAEQDRKSVV